MKNKDCKHIILTIFLLFTDLKIIAIGKVKAGTIL
jgi:hypothetical protein